MDRNSESNMKKAIAIDLGASSGRVISITLSEGTLSLDVIHRFDNYLIEGDTLRWNLDRIEKEIGAGLEKISFCAGDSISVDTWGVDYVLLDADGSILDTPFCYRDERTDGAIQKAEKMISAKELYMRTGIEVLEINTLFQLMAEQQRGLVMFIPDYLLSRLSGIMNTEISIASTSGLINPYTRSWDTDLIHLLGLSDFSFLPSKASGKRIGEYKHDSSVSIISGCGHDTEAAAVAIPSEKHDFLFLSCGTWSLMGTETDCPIITESSEESAFTNETGFDGKNLFMKNITGLWILQCLKKELKKSYDEMEEEAAASSPFIAFIDTDAPVFKAPGPMKERILSYIRETDQKIPASDGEIFRLVNESLAMKYRLTRDKIEQCTGKHYEEIHIVGGGSQSALLCSFTSSSLAIPVIAGPVEATAYGNALIQFMTRGEIPSLKEARKLVSELSEIRTVQPDNAAVWDEAYNRYKRIMAR